MSTRVKNKLYHFLVNPNLINGQMKKNLNHNIARASIQLFIFFSFFFNCINTNAQINSSKGLPTITTYLPKEYKGNSQVWSIIQDDRGFMYFGTSGGILEYDGINWKKLKFPRTSSLISTRAFFKGKDGRIFYGALGDLGYFDFDKYGNTRMVSLLDFLPDEFKVFNDVWTIHQVGEIIYFQTRDVIFLFDISSGLESPKVKVWLPDTSFLYTFFENGEYILHQQELGLFKLVGDKLELIPGSEFLGMERVQVLMPYPLKSSGTNGLLIGMFSGGMYLYDGLAFSPFSTNGYTPGSSDILYKGLLQPDGNYVLGFAGTGINIIDKKGIVQYSFKLSNGLANESIYSVNIDLTGMLWIGSESGIAKIEISSPLTRFSLSKKGNPNILSFAALDGDLYMGTSTELLKLSQSEGQIESVPDVPFSQIFQLTKDGNDLLVATEGLVAVRDKKVITIKSSVGGDFQLFDILVSKFYPDLLFCSGSSGVSVLRRTKKGPGEEPGWKFLGNINGTTKDIYNLVEDEEGVIWGGTNAGTVYKIKLGITASKQYDLPGTKVEIAGIEQGLDNVVGPVFKVRDKIFIPTYRGFFSKSKDSDLFHLDSIFGVLSENAEISSENVLLSEDELGRVLVIFGNNKKLALPQPNGGYILEDSPINLFTGEIITAFFSEPDGTIWLASDEGLIRIDGTKKTPTEKNFPVYITSAIAGQDTLIRISQKGEVNFPELGFKNNSVRFDFASPFFEQEKRTVYQTLLEGFEDDWSSWSNNSYKEYTNLSPGQYTFRVRARNIYNNLSDEAVLTFIILSPWYAKWWAYLIYILLLFLLVTAIVKWRSRKLKIENRMLEEKVHERTQQLENSLVNLKSTQAQLIQSEKMASLGELTAGIAHEIQNPLNFVNNFSEVSNELIDEMNEVLDDGNIDEAKEISQDLKQNLEKINHHGKRADAIVKGMLEHSRTNSGERTEIDINALCDEYLRLSYHGLRAKDKSFNAVFQTDFDPNLPKINVVAQDIGRVLLNLINNAFYVVNEKSKEGEVNYEPLVEVTTRKTGSGFEISVKDNGNGIPDHIKDKIFQPFFTTKPTGEGTGLGLSLSYDIVKSHGGEIKIESIEGQGAEFILNLPI